MAQKGFSNLAKKRTLEDRGNLPKEAGDLAREPKHGESVHSVWLGEDMDGRLSRRNGGHAQGSEGRRACQ